MPSFDGNLLIQRHEIWSQQTRDFALSYGDQEVYLTWVPGCVRQTDRIAVVSTR